MLYICRRYMRIGLARPTRVPVAVCNSVVNPLCLFRLSSLYLFTSLPPSQVLSFTLLSYPLPQCSSSNRCPSSEDTEFFTPPQLGSKPVSLQPAPSNPSSERARAWPPFQHLVPLSSSYYIFTIPSV